MFGTGSLEVPVDAWGDPVNAGLLVLRLCLGLFLAYHGYNKIFGPNGLSGTAAWFASIGFKWPAAQARIAAATEIGAGIMFAAGLVTPLASAGIIGIMIVAIVVAHWKVGFFVFHPGQGWEYCATIAIGAASVAMIGPGAWSIDHVIDISVIDISPSGWTSTLIAVIVGVGSAGAQLAVSYRPRPGS
jgi:putative oxidoreductase